MSDYTPFEPRPDDEPSGRRRRFRPTRREVLRAERSGRERLRGCARRGGVRARLTRRRPVSGCPRGR